MNRKIICEINKTLNTKVLVIIDHVKNDYLEEIFSDLQSRKSDSIEVWHSDVHFPSSEMVRFVSREELDEVLELYRLYDFSDKIIILSDTEQYATLFNYIRNRIITPKEFVEVLLLKN